VTSGGNNYIDFSDNQLTKFRVFIGWSRIFILPPKFPWSIAFRPPTRWTPLTDTMDRRTNTNKQTGVLLCPFVSYRWSLTLCTQRNRIAISQFAHRPICYTQSYNASNTKSVNSDKSYHVSFNLSNWLVAKLSFHQSVLRYFYVWLYRNSFGDRICWRIDCAPKPSGHYLYSEKKRWRKKDREWRKGERGWERASSFSKSLGLGPKYV